MAPLLTHLRKVFLTNIGLGIFQSKAFSRSYQLSFISRCSTTRSLVMRSQKNCANLSQKFSTSSANAEFFKLELEVPSAEDMEDVGAVLSVGTKGGDVILLDGDLGAGKTCFSRGFVRARTGFMDTRVTSPTFLLSRTYEAGEKLLIHHMDLYRLSGDTNDLAPLNLEYVLKECISLIEWPSRLGSLLPNDRLDITFRITDIGEDKNEEEYDNARYLMLEAHGEQWTKRLKSVDMEGYLDDMIIESAQ